MPVTENHRLLWHDIHEVTFVPFGLAFDLPPFFQIFFPFTIFLKSPILLKSDLQIFFTTSFVPILAFLSSLCLYYRILSIYSLLIHLVSLVYTAFIYVCSNMYQVFGIQRYRAGVLQYTTVDFFLLFLICSHYVLCFSIFGRQSHF